MYQFKEEISEGFFWFDKQLIENGNWAMLPPSSKSIYPVLCSFRHKDTGIAFPAEQTIAILSGRTEKTVREGIRQLNDFPGLTITPYITKFGKQSKKFTIQSPPKKEGRSFTFHSKIIEGGNWGILPPTAQALYPAMRYYCFHDIYECCDEENDYDGDFLNRQYDLCEADLSLLARRAGIDRTSVHSAIESLKEHCLVATRETDGDGWRVYLKPTQIYKREYLNQKSIKRYR